MPPLFLIMTDAQMGHLQDFVRLLSLALMIAPVCWIAVYWVLYMPQPPSNGRQRRWYLGYSVAFVCLLVTAGV